MLNCKNIDQLSSDYIDKQLSWPKRIAVKLHLIICRQCRCQIKQLQTLIKTLPKLPFSNIPSHEDDIVAAMLKEKHHSK